MSNAINIIATASRFAIAAAIVYFAYQLAQINNNLPAVMVSIDQVSKQIEPTLEEVRGIRQEVEEVRRLVPEILAEVAEVRKQIPSMVAEVTELRQQVPPILVQIEAINQQIDPILARIDKTVAVVDNTQRQIPQIIITADNAIAALNQARVEVVPLVPKALDEIRLTREKIDPTLDRVDDLVEDAYFKATDAIGAADKAGQEASEGAIKGFFTGLIKLPFELIGTLASPILNSIDKDVAKQLTEKDIELMTEAGKRAVESNRVDRERRWKNPDSGNSGSMTLIRKYQLQGNDCVETRVRINNKRKQIMDKLDNFCLNQENEWILANDIDK